MLIALIALGTILLRLPIAVDPGIDGGGHGHRARHGRRVDVLALRRTGAPGAGPDRRIRHHDDRVGSSVAHALAEMGYEVLGIDASEQIVHDHSGALTRRSGRQHQPEGGPAVHVRGP
jgi:hypothetical protein